MINLSPSFLTLCRIALKETWVAVNKLRRCADRRAFSFFSLGQCRGGGAIIVLPWLYATAPKPFKYFHAVSPAYTILICI